MAGLGNGVRINFKKIKNFQSPNAPVQDQQLRLLGRAEEGEPNGLSESHMNFVTFFDNFRNSFYFIFE